VKIISYGLIGIIKTYKFYWCWKEAKQFIETIGLELSSNNEFRFAKDMNYYVQELTYSKYDESLPYFVLPISSATHKNIDGVRNALYNLVSRDKCEE